MRGCMQTRREDFEVDVQIEQALEPVGFLAG